jgi:glycosyltransferase involved in cell wall biosynthesis
VIPTRNRWAVLQRALLSATSQQEVDVEVLVVDDASTDGTPDRVEQLGDARVRVIRRGTSGGPGAARNAGIAAAKGEWVAFLDDDDLWSPRKLLTQLDAAEAAGAALVYADAIALDDELAVIEALPAPHPSDLADTLMLGGAIPAGSSNVIMHATLIERLGGFDERLSQLADWDLWIRATANSSAARCPEVLVGYVHHSGSMMTGHVRTLRREYRYLRRKHREVARGRAQGFDPAGFERWIGWGESRAGSPRRAAARYLSAAARYAVTVHPFAAGRSVRDAGRALRGGGLTTTGFPRDPGALRPDWVAAYEGV